MSVARATKAHKNAYLAHSRSFIETVCCTEPRGLKSAFSALWGKAGLELFLSPLSLPLLLRTY